MPGIPGIVQRIRDSANDAIKSQEEGHIHFDPGYPVYFVTLLHIADQLEKHAP